MHVKTFVLIFNVSYLLVMHRYIDVILKQYGIELIIAFAVCQLREIVS